MITLTALELGIRRALISLAVKANPDEPFLAPVTYADVGRVCDPHGVSHYPMTRPPFRGLNVALGHVSMYEVEHGRPMITALVVHEADGTPGPGFAKLACHLGYDVEDEVAFWQNELVEVIRVWTSDDPTIHIDAALGVVVEELQSIKTILRRGLAS